MNKLIIKDYIDAVVITETPENGEAFTFEEVYSLLQWEDLYLHISGNNEAVIHDTHGGALYYLHNWNNSSLSEPYIPMLEAVNSGGRLDLVLIDDIDTIRELKEDLDL